MLEQELQMKASQAQSRGEENNKANKSIQSHYAFNKPIIPPVSSVDIIVITSLYASNQYRVITPSINQSFLP